jgi:hypothetical protein
MCYNTNSFIFSFLLKIENPFKFKYKIKCFNYSNKLISIIIIFEKKKKSRFHFICQKIGKIKLYCQWVKNSKK